MYSPSSIQKTISGDFSSNGKFPNLSGKSLAIFNSYCNSLKNWQFKNGILTNEDASYFALDILNQYPIIGTSLVKRFSYVVLDEAQDTSEIHFAIFDRLIELGLKNIEIIGDPCQSLYEWREARPDLFINRANDTKNWDNYEYNFCRRSEQNIIDVYSKLRNGGNPIKSSIKGTTNKIQIIKYELGKEEKAVERFIELSSTSTNKQVVVRGRTMLQKLLGYSDNKNYWKTNISTLLISAKQHLAKNEISKAVNTVRKIFVLILYPDLNIKEQRSFENELKADFETSSEIINFIRNLPSFELSLKNWTIETEAYIKKFFELDDDFSLELKQRQGEEIYSSSINKLHNINENESSFPISTIHQVKGKTFDSLMLILSNNSIGQNISLSDYSKPIDFPNDSKRMIYVALSRPRNFLAIAVPAETKNEILFELFGNELEIN
ncbi:MAG: UvrD-helicase domain-containing protein [Bacteroidota bacterium]